jgi:hypothetical protein
MVTSISRLVPFKTHNLSLKVSTDGFILALRPLSSDESTREIERFFANRSSISTTRDKLSGSTCFGLSKGLLLIWS